MLRPSEKGRTRSGLGANLSISLYTLQAQFWEGFGKRAPTAPAEEGPGICLAKQNPEWLRSSRASVRKSGAPWNLGDSAPDPLEGSKAPEGQGSGGPAPREREEEARKVADLRRSWPWHRRTAATSSVSSTSVWVAPRRAMAHSPRGLEEPERGGRSSAWVWGLYRALMQEALGAAGVAGDPAAPQLSASSPGSGATYMRSAPLRLATVPKPRAAPGPRPDCNLSPHPRSPHLPGPDPPLPLPLR